MARSAVALGLLASVARGTARAQSYEVGSISGVISFPGDAVPALRIYALGPDGKPYRMITTPPLATRFVIDHVPAGKYHVVGYRETKEGAPAGAVGWTRAARCVKGPCDHTLIPIQVSAGKMSEGVVLADWYVPAAILPPDPAAAPPKAPPAACDKEPTDAARDACHRRAHEAADQEVNRLYERLMRALERSPRCHEDLRNAQLAWLRFRDQQCVFESAMGEKGRAIRCQRELTEARAAYLGAQNALTCNR
jgi:uncharacterized protein YecT (DUF1311 family)